MFTADTECSVEGREEAKGQEKILCLNFPCIVLEYESESLI